MPGARTTLPVTRLFLLLLVLSRLSSFSIPGSSVEFRDLAGRLQQAQTAMESGNYPKAVSLYREMIEDRPELPELRMYLGIAYYLSGEHARAVDPLQQVLPEVGRHEAFDTALFFLGAAYSELGKHAPAVDVLTQYVRRRPKDPQSRTLLGEALLSKGRYREAAEQFEILAELQPSMPQAWYALGKCYEALAAESFDRLAAGDPESAYSLALLGHARLAEHRYEAAFHLYRKALEKDPEIRGLHAALSRIYEATGHPDEWAEVERKRELNLGPLNCESEPLVCDFTGSRFREVLERSRGRESPEALYWGAQASLRLADDAYDRLALLPPSFELHRLKAETQEKRDRPLEVVREWESAQELATNPAAERVAGRGLAVAHFQNRDFSRAKVLIDGLLKADPANSELYYYAGRILLEQGKSREAVPFLEEALRGSGSFSAAHAALGRAYLNLGEVDQALRHLESALDTDRDGSVHYLAAQLHRRRGDEERARELVERHREIQEERQIRFRELDENFQITPP